MRGVFKGAWACLPGASAWVTPSTVVELEPFVLDQLCKFQTMRTGSIAALLAALLVQCADGRSFVKRESSAKAWINGKEIDMSRGGTYTDKNGNFVSVNNSGGGISMVSSSGGNSGGCTIVVSFSSHFVGQECLEQRRARV
jgi:hypothetical protein